MSDKPKKPSRFARRLQRMRDARHAKPTNRQRIAGFAFGVATAFFVTYLCFVWFGTTSFSFWYLGLLILTGAGIGVIIGWRALGKAGFAGLGAGLWIFFELMMAGFVLLVEAITIGIGAFLSSCSF